MKIMGFHNSKIDSAIQQNPIIKKRPVLFWLVLIEIFLFAIAAGLSIAHPYLQRQRAIEQIRSLGGTVYEEPKQPRWLNRITRNIPLHKSSKVVAIDLSSATVDDETMELLAAFPDISYLSIHGPEVTPQAFENLLKLHSLRTLLLIDCPQFSAHEEEFLHEANPQVAISRRGAALLGITGQRHRWGCEIISIRPHSGASRAGLKEGDIIVSFAGSRVKGFDSLTDSISKYRPGDDVTVGYFRGHRKHYAEVTLGSWTDKVY